MFLIKKFIQMIIYSNLKNWKFFEFLFFKFIKLLIFLAEDYP